MINAMIKPLARSRSKRALWGLAVTPLFLLLSIFPARISLAATYYIDPSGSNVTGNGTQAKPWNSLSHACSRVTAYGDRIYINPGSYRDDSPCTLSRGVSIEGASSDSAFITTDAYDSSYYAYISIASNSPIQPGNNTISGFTIDGDRSDSDADGRRGRIAIRIRGKDNVSIHDMKIQNFSCGAVWIHPYFDWSNYWYNPPPAWGKNIQLYNITINTTTVAENVFGAGERQGAVVLDALEGADIHHLSITETQSNAGTGFKMAGGGWLKRCIIRDSTITMNAAANNGNSFPIEVYNWYDDSEIFGNTFNGALSFNSGSATLYPGSSWNLKVYNNTFNLGGLKYGMFAMEVSHHWMDIYGNYFSGNQSGVRGIGIWNTNYLTASSVSHVRIRNNVFYNFTWSAVSVEQSGSYSYIDIYNNTIDNISDARAIYFSSGTITNSNIKNNIFINCQGYPVYLHSGTRSTSVTNNCFNGNTYNTVSNQGSGNTIANNTVANPGLNRSGARPAPYYLPSSGSTSIIDTGINIGLPFSGSAPDIGAYEYTSSDGGSYISPPTGLRVITQ